MTHAPDLLLLSQYNPDLGEVAAFEELIGSHGGLGGPQTEPFILHPVEWELDEPVPLGAPAIYRNIRRWLESIGIELFSAMTSRRLFSALHHRIHTLGLVNEYYEAAFQQIVDEGVTLYGVDIGSLYATEIDTYEDLRSANHRLAQRPAFDLHVHGLRLAV